MYTLNENNTSTSHFKRKRSILNEVSHYNVTARDCTKKRTARLNMSFRTGKICATVWASRAARQRAIVFGSFLFESVMILGYWTYCLWSSAARVHHPALFLCFLANLLQSYTGHPRRSPASLSCLNAKRCCCSCTSCSLRTQPFWQGPFVCFTSAVLCVLVI